MQARPTIALPCPALPCPVSQADIKRTVINTHRLRDVNFLVNWFGTLPPDWAMECLAELLRSNMRFNAKHVVTIATKYTEAMGVDKLLGE